MSNSNKTCAKYYDFGELENKKATQQSIFKAKCSGLRNNEASK